MFTGEGKCVFENDVVYILGVKVEIGYNLASNGHTQKKIPQPKKVAIAVHTQVFKRQVTYRYYSVLYGQAPNAKTHYLKQFYPILERKPI